MENKDYSKFKKIYRIVLSGIVILAIILGTYLNIGKYSHPFFFNYRNSFKSGDETSASESLDISDDIEAISVDADITDLSVVYGEKANIRYDYRNYNAPEFSVDDGILNVKQETDNVDFTTGMSDNCTIVITIPRNTILNSLDIRVSCGNVSIEDIKCGKLNIEADLGDIELSKITSEETTIEADCGNIEAVKSSMANTEVSEDLGNIDFKDVTFAFGVFTNSMGDVNISGNFDKIKADCDMGSIDITSDKDIDEDDLDLSVGLGSITVNGKEW